MSAYRPAYSIVDHGQFYKFCYINVKKSKVLGTFQTHSYGSPWTLRMTPAAELAHVQHSAGVLTFLNTGDTPFPMVLIGRAGAVRVSRFVQGSSAVSRRR